MGKLVINHHLVTPEKAEALAALCPFGAISYADGKLDISSGCKMCKMCVRKGQGLVDFVEETTEIDKSQWKGICVYADCTGGVIHRVTFELCGKAKELAQVTGHPVYALVIGHNTALCAKKLLHYGVDRFLSTITQNLRTSGSNPTPQLSAILLKRKSLPPFWWVQPIWAVSWHPVWLPGAVPA